MFISITPRGYYEPDRSSMFNAAYPRPTIFREYTKRQVVTVSSSAIKAVYKVAHKKEDGPRTMVHLRLKGRDYTIAVWETQEELDNLLGTRIAPSTEKSLTPELDPRLPL